MYIVVWVYHCLVGDWVWEHLMLNCVHCVALYLVYLAKVVRVVLSFVTLRQWFTGGGMSSDELVSDGPFDWAHTEECTRLNGFSAAFLG